MNSAEKASEADHICPVQLIPTEWLAHLIASDGFTHTVSYDAEKRVAKGIMGNPTMTSQIVFTDTEWTLWIADSQQNTFRTYRGTMSCVTSSSEEAAAAPGIIDICQSGRRWEGGVLKDQPFGWGTFYRDDGKKEYEGWMNGQTRVCYGIEYFEDVELPSYQGYYFQGKRHGFGSLYERNGTVQYEGYWMEGERASEVSSPVCSQMETIAFRIGNGPIGTFTLTPYLLRLKHLIIGNQFLSSTDRFLIESMMELETLVVGDYNLVENAMKGKSGLFRVASCPNLQSIYVQNYSCGVCGVFQLEYLPSLHSLQVGEGSFSGVSVFHLEGGDAEFLLPIELPQLETVSLGDRSFNACREIVFQSGRRKRLLPRPPAVAVRSAGLGRALRTRQETVSGKRELGGDEECGWRRRMTSRFAFTCGNSGKGVQFPWSRFVPS